MAPSYRPKASPGPDINVTPLVDVVLVLLIIFMVVVPAMDSAQQVELPKVEAVDEGDKPKSVVVVLSEDQSLSVDDKIVQTSELPNVLAAQGAGTKQKPIELRADARLPFSVVRTTFVSLEGAGFRNVSLTVEEPEPGS